MKENVSIKMTTVNLKFTFWHRD